MPSATETTNEDLQRPNSETALVKVESPDHEGLDAESERQLTRRQATSRSLRKWTIRAGVLILLAAIIGFFSWRNSRPTAVATVQPKLAPITETVADRILLIEDGLVHEISKDEHRKRMASLA